MIHLILLFLGLGIGAVFLVVLLIGDWKEARRAAHAKAVQEQARQPVEGAWPPPPIVSALPPQPAFAKPAATRAASRKMVKNFFLVRNYTLAVVVLAYIVYSCLPRFNFVWVLLATAGTALVIRAALALWKRRVRS